MSDAPCRTDLGPLTKRLLEQQQEIERLRAERDEARREVCNLMHKTGFLNGDYADSRGWDCFKEDGK
jgi:hypothetical protein